MVKEHVNFYDVGGLLIRRPRRVRRGVSAEVWQRDGWVAYPDLDAVLRHGHRLNEAKAAALLLELQQRTDPSIPFSEKEARIALQAPSKRSESI